MLYNSLEFELYGRGFDSCLPRHLLEKLTTNSHFFYTQTKNGDIKVEEIDLSLKYLGSSSKDGYDLTREPYIAEMIDRIANKQDVFVRFGKNDKKRPGAIAKVKKIEGYGPSSDPYSYHKGVSDYTVHLKWDDRKNTAKVELNNSIYGSRLTYLRDYSGKTEWSLFDAKKEAEKRAKPILDRLGNEIKLGSTVVYINARYGSGAELDFGTVKDIKQKAYKRYRSDNIDIETTVVIETIATKDNEVVMESKIKRPDSSIMVLNDVDLFDQAFVAKLSIDQGK